MTYRLLTKILWPVFFIYTLKIALRDKSLRYFFQRLGVGYSKSNKKNIWIHCASVGEVNTYFPLHMKLLEKDPHAQFVITTNTVTGAEIVANKISQYNLKQTQHCFLPIESTFAINRFLSSWRPSQCLIMETEIWPLLYHRCSINNISISIINARLSHRTLNANNWIKSLYKTSLSSVSKIICKSQTEINNFITLGAIPSQCVMGGNLKFTSIENSQSEPPIKLNGHRYCLAASTHNDEELQLATLWKKLTTDFLLIIVPRHPNRSLHIQKQLDTLGIQYSVRSKKQTLFNDTKIYLADTLGELTQFMQDAECVFMGGSLIKHGGQNILEPCRLGKPTICGPHMFNFKDEMAFLLEKNACLQVNNLNELETVISEFTNNPETLKLIGDNAKSALQKQSTILDAYVSILFASSSK